MTDKIDLQKQLETFKSQIKEVNKSLYKFESEFEKEKVKIDKLRHSFCMVVKLINKDLIDNLASHNLTLEKVQKLLKN